MPRLVPGAVLAAAIAAATAEAAVSGATITVHNEPHLSASQNWPRLVAIVARADTLGLRLNLLLGANWAEHALASSDRLTTLAAWVKNGHQIGFHHHDVSHVAWDGYCDVPIAACAGAPSVLLAAGLLDRLEQELRARGVPPGATSDVNLACQGPAIEYRGYEWAQDFVFAQGRSDESPAAAGRGTLTRTTCADYGGPVAQIGGKQLAVGSFGREGATLEDVLADIPAGGAGEYLSVVFHSQEYVDVDVDRDGTLDRQEIDAVLQAIAERVGPSMLMSEVLLREAPCGR